MEEKVERITGYTTGVRKSENVLLHSWNIKLKTSNVTKEKKINVKF